MSKVSIIVPVYGVEAYLEECVDSLIAQRYEDLEILLVDDASPDQCPKICEEYAQKDQRVKVIHKLNGGAASARNAGLDAATGDLICFVDSDDAVEPDYVAHLVKTLRESGADIAICGFALWTKKDFEFYPMVAKPGCYSREEYLRCFLRDWSCALLWNKIYRREAIGHLRMLEGHRIDDEYFTYQVCMNCRSVAVSDRNLYRYRLRKSGVMQGSATQEQIILDRIGYTTQRYDHIARQIPELEAAYFADALDSMIRYWRISKDMPYAQRQIRKWVNCHVGKILGMKTALRQKLACLYTLYCCRPVLAGETSSFPDNRTTYFD